MTVQAYRITHAKYAASAFDGEGARQYGGRWNSPGVPMIYTASSRSLATLELLVHLEDLATLRERFVVISVAFPAALVLPAELGKLPRGWNGPSIMPSTQRVGDRWAASLSSAVLRVPSIVTPGEDNYLINPLHPDFKKIAPGKPVPLHLDPRLGQ